MRERPEMPPEPPWGHKSLNAVLPREPPWAKGLRSAVSLEAKGYPANCIHFQAAVKYCAWLSKLTGRKFRLPTEAEWEYACRAGGPRAKPDAKALADLAWFAGNSADEPHPVGEKRPNAWGLYDMLGNVGEYVVRDPNDDKGLAAGGSFEDEAKDVNSGAREPYSPAWGKNDPFDPKSTNWFLYDVHHLGFRVVMDE
jgi:formylglycine-generating enzyme required for sulfatase activity